MLKAITLKIENIKIYRDVEGLTLPIRFNRIGNGSNLIDSNAKFWTWKLTGNLTWKVKNESVIDQKSTKFDLKMIKIGLKMVETVSEMHL